MYAWHQKEYFGMAHGISGIVNLLLHDLSLLGDDTTAQEEAKLAIRKVCEYLISTKLPTGNYPTRLDAHDRDVLVQWCHGCTAIGILLCTAARNDIGNNEEFVEEAVKIADVVWERGLLKKGLGLCHGISGNAYLFVYLYLATRDLKHLHRAWQFVKFSMSDAGRATWNKPEKPYSLFNGLAGAVYFYTDLLWDVDQAYFPTCDLK